MGRNRINGLALCTLKFGFSASVRAHGACDVLCSMFASQLASRRTQASIPPRFLCPHHAPTSDQLRRNIELVYLAIQDIDRSEV
jgi:hypothetical protein